jgi:transcriptional regulator with XRE-family HTH domain
MARMSEQPDLFSQLSDDRQREMIERLRDMEYCAARGIAMRSQAKDLAVFVRFQRHMRQWKVETLASFAGLSRSTIERIERGEPVADESLDQVAVALGYNRGDFTEPRVPLGGYEAIAQWEKWLRPFEGHRWIVVEPVRKQRQVAAFSECHTYLLDGGRLEVDLAEELGSLREWLNYVAIIRYNAFIERTERERRRVSRRDLYRDVLAQIHQIESDYHAVALGGTYEAETNHRLIPRVQIAVIGFFPMATDPSAIRRRQLLVPKRVELVWPAGA